MAINVKIGSGSPLSVQTISQFVGASDQGVQAAFAFAKANAAFDAANTKLSLTGGTVSGNIIPSTGNVYYLGSINNPWHSIYVGPSSLFLGNTILSSANGGLTITDANGNIKNLTDARDTANAAFSQANAAFSQANAAFSQANSTASLVTIISNTGAAVNATQNTNINLAFAQANTAFAAANTSSNVAALAFAQANAAFAAANASTGASGAAAFTQANAAFDVANTSSNVATLAFTQSNAAFVKANTAITSTGGTISGNVTISNTTVSVSNTTGALIVAGGLGVSGNIFVDGITITSNNLNGNSITVDAGLF